MERWIVLVLWYASSLGATENGTQSIAQTGPKHVARLGCVKPSCAREAPGICLKRRCIRDPDASDEHFRKTLSKEVGDDWPQVRDAILAVWEVILYSAETYDAEAFANILSYPLTFSMAHEESDVLWESWTLHTPEEVKKIFPYIMNPLTRHYMFWKPTCHFSMMNISSGRFFFYIQNFNFLVKKLTFGQNLVYDYNVVIKDLSVASSNYFDDIGRIRYELGRPGNLCNPARQCAQPKPRRPKR